MITHILAGRAEFNVYFDGNPGPVSTARFPELLVNCVSCECVDGQVVVVRAAKVVC